MVDEIRPGMRILCILTLYGNYPTEGQIYVAGEIYKELEQLTLKDELPSSKRYPIKAFVPATPLNRMKYRAFTENGTLKYKVQSDGTLKPF